MVLWNTQNLAHVPRVSRATGPDVASALYFTCRFVIFALVVICDTKGGISPQYLITTAFRSDTLDGHTEYVR